MDGLTDGWTDDPNTRCPRQTFQARGIKILAVLYEQCQCHIFFMKFFISSLFLTLIVSCKSKVNNETGKYPTISSVLTKYTWK